MDHVSLTAPEPSQRPVDGASSPRAAIRPAVEGVAEGLADLDDVTWSSLEQLGRVLQVQEAGLQATLVAVLTAAVELIDGAQAAGLNLYEKGKFAPQAVLGVAPPQLDELQQRTGVGPCIEASREQCTIALTDTRRDERWPTFTAAAVRLGVLSMLCVPLWVDDRRLGSLSLYAPTAEAFTGAATRLAGLYATHAALALADAQRTEQLHRVIANRDVIGQAKGILMATRGLRAEEAFDVLVTTSQRLNRKLVEVAEVLAATGALPTT